MQRMPSNELRLNVNAIDFIYDELDSNAVNFLVDNGYFSIQTSIYLEDDERLNEPFIELNEPSNVQCGGIEQVLFADNEITIEFSPTSMLVNRFTTVRLGIASGVSKETVDFFVNFLFLADRVTYSNSFDQSNVCPATAKRTLL
jgi:hypothetical protein